MNMGDNEYRQGPRAETVIRIDPSSVAAEPPPRCFLLMRSDKDMHGLSQHGEVVVVHDGGRRPSFWSQEFVDLTHRKLVETGYRHGADFLVAAGPLVPLAKVLCELTRYYEEKPRVLFFDAARQGFVEG